jgi:histidinol-phosphate aminotransferase
VVPSAANFILITGFDIPAPQLWQMMLDRGVLIRDVGLSGYIRVTIGNDAENKKFVDALSKCLNGDK